MYKKKIIFGIITARSGSKSIKNKNLKLLGGKPLVFYPIKTSLDSKYIDRTLVTTDSNKIAKISIKYNCEVPFIRPKKYAQDLSTDYSVFKHLSVWLKSKKMLPDYFVHLRPTCPIRNAKLIDQAIKKFIDGKYFDSLKSIEVAKETPFKMWLKNQNQIKPVILLKKNKESHCLPRQILPITYWQNGYVDIYKCSNIVKKNSLCGTNVMPFLIKEAVFELDYPEDLRKLKANFKKKRKNQKTFRHPN